jgi:hypothetical protein
LNLNLQTRSRPRRAPWLASVRIPEHLHRKDVPHLSESLLIGIERWRFVEGVVK